MFIIDVSPSMGDTRVITLPPGPNGEPRKTEITNLQWSLKYVKHKIQQMVSIHPLPPVVDGGVTRALRLDICGTQDGQMRRRSIWD